MLLNSGLLIITAYSIKDTGFFSHGDTKARSFKFNYVFLYLTNGNKPCFFSAKETPRHEGFPNCVSVVLIEITYKNQTLRLRASVAKLRVAEDDQKLK